jgi:hypothetical protein
MVFVIAPTLLVVLRSELKLLPMVYPFAKLPTLVSPLLKLPDPSQPPLQLSQPLEPQDLVQEVQVPVRRLL